jgi:hypothetical protein
MTLSKIQNLTLGASELTTLYEQPTGNLLLNFKKKTLNNAGMISLFEYLYFSHIIFCKFVLRLGVPSVISRLF